MYKFWVSLYSLPTCRTQKTTHKDLRLSELNQGRLLIWLIKTNKMNISQICRLSSDNYNTKSTRNYRICIQCFWCWILNIYIYTSTTPVLFLFDCLVMYFSLMERSTGVKFCKLVHCYLAYVFTFCFRFWGG